MARVRAGLLNYNNGFTPRVFIRVPTQDPHLVKMFYVIQLGRKQVRPHKLIKENPKTRMNTSIFMSEYYISDF